MTLVAGLAIINATGVHAQLVAAPAQRGEATEAVETQTATLDAKIGVQAYVVAEP